MALLFAERAKSHATQKAHAMYDTHYMSQGPDEFETGQRSAAAYHGERGPYNDPWAIQCTMMKMKAGSRRPLEVPGGLTLKVVVVMSSSKALQQRH